MNSRERIRAIMAGQAADRCGFWLGSPHHDTWPLLHKYFGTSAETELRCKLHDDFCWIGPGAAYKHPQGRSPFNLNIMQHGYGSAGVFAECEAVQQVEDYEWPNPDYLDFTEVLECLRKDTWDYYRLSGFWSPFFHDVADFFGMENYFVKMYTHPEVVHAVTRHVVDFYLEANERFFDKAGGLVDAFFFGNDFGTQRDLLISPEAFKEFVSPYFRQLTDLGHQHGLPVVLHSCGAIKRVIPDLINFGVNALHPLQAKADNMSAELLAEFKGKIAFIGGIDTQDLLVNGTPAEVKADVRRVKQLLGPCLVVSPSHEALLPNVPPRNVAAMVEAAIE